MNMVVKIKYNFQVRPIIWPYTHKKKTYETKNAKKTHTKQVQEMYTLLKRYHEFENKMAKMKAKRQ